MNAGEPQPEDRDDDFEASALITPLCFDCKHFQAGDPTPSGRLRCKAFDEIPPEIVYSEFDHTQPYPGDHGIQFEPTAESLERRAQFARKPPA